MDVVEPALTSLPLTLITGGARRVDCLTALHLASKGCAIGLHYQISETDAEKTTAEIQLKR